MYLLDMFIKYVGFDSMSDPFSETAPSTAQQKTLGDEIVKDMLALGVADARMSAGGVVYGSIPASSGYEGEPCIGLIAHMDTSPDLSGKDVKPRIIKDYDGGDINFKNYHDPLSPLRFPTLKEHIGKTLIVTDGSTLLGADDKAGIAEIMDAIRVLNEEGIPHGRIAIGFTPDEEIGRGVDNFDLAEFGAEFAYTLDGGNLEHIEYECFNAASLTVAVTGFNIHPGAAKNQMKNASLIAFEYDSMLPAEQRPQYTEGYEGFFHLSSVEGDEEKALLRYIVRDHDKGKFAKKKELAKKISEFLNEKYGDSTVRAELEDTYYNMLDVLKPHMHIVERAKCAMENAGITPQEKAIRGGTDGSRLSYMGLPCPNLPTGGHNYHGRFEYIPLEDMQKAVEVVVNIVDARHSIATNIISV